ncbi:MAG: hypothetical protein J0626_11980, partial [Rhodospirillaceae bacterium]|nr:hypothetical protein [Rhodospirillaceae bacterium]
MSNSLRRKLFLAFVGMAVLPLVLAGAALILTAFRLQERQSLSVQSQVGRSIVNEFRNYMGMLVLELEGPVRQRGLA